MCIRDRREARHLDELPETVADVLKQSLHDGFLFPENVCDEADCGARGPGRGVARE